MSLYKIEHLSEKPIHVQQTDFNQWTPTVNTKLKGMII